MLLKNLWPHNSNFRSGGCVPKIDGASTPSIAMSANFLIKSNEASYGARTFLAKLNEDQALRMRKLERVVA
jgi:hypothetical protein